MNDKLFCTGTPVTLVGGGAIDPGDLDLALSRAPALVAADSGAAPVLAAGHVPDAVFGDFDSISTDALSRIPEDRLFPIAEQDTTDFHKALSRISAPMVLAVGFLGDRVDHQLAVLNVLVQLTEKACVLIGRHEVIFHLPAHLEVQLEPGDVVSLFPMGAVSGRSTGLEWPIDGLAFTPAGQIGTSNRALGPVILEMDGPGMVGILPLVRLDEVIVSLRSRADVV